VAKVVVANRYIMDNIRRFIISIHSALGFSAREKIDLAKGRHDPFSMRSMTQAHLSREEDNIQDIHIHESHPYRLSFSLLTGDRNSNTITIPRCRGNVHNAVSFIAHFTPYCGSFSSQRKKHVSNPSLR
jgi:hypothetical protein